MASRVQVYPAGSRLSRMPRRLGRLPKTRASSPAQCDVSGTTRFKKLSGSLRPSSQRHRSSNVQSASSGALHRCDRIDAKRLDDKFLLPPRHRFSSWVPNAERDRAPIRHDAKCSKNGGNASLPTTDRDTRVSTAPPHSHAALPLLVAATPLAISEGETAARQSDGWKAMHWQSWPRAPARPKG